MDFIIKDFQRKGLEVSFGLYSKRNNLMGFLSMSIGEYRIFKEKMERD